MAVEATTKTQKDFCSNRKARAVHGSFPGFLGVSVSPSLVELVFSGVRARRLERFRSTNGLPVRPTTSRPAGTGGRKRRSLPDRQRGIILIALLWVLVALSLLALNLSSTVRSESSVALASAEAERTYFYARGGLEMALYALVYPQQDPEKQRRLFLYRDGMNHFPISNGESFCHVAIQDEAGKVDLNFAPEPLLKRLLENVGVEETRADALAAAIVAWRESHGLVGLEGREDQSSRRRLFSSVEELLWVPGVSREIVYGTVTEDKAGKATVRRGLADFATVYSGKLQVNLNYADPEVIAALPGMDRDAAEAIVSARADEPIGTGHVTQQIASLISGEAASFITTTPSNVYSLVATAFLKDSRLQRSIRSVVKMDGALRWGHSKLIWYDEYWPSDRVLQWTRSKLVFPGGLETSQNSTSLPCRVVAPRSTKIVGCAALFNAPFVCSASEGVEDWRTPKRGFAQASWTAAVFCRS